MIIARQSTARTVMVGPVLDADGVAITDCVVADFKGSVNGGDPAALNGSATLTHRGVGFYSLALTATDLGTVGSFEVTINDTVNACPMKEITVIEEAVYDDLFAASAVGYPTAAEVVNEWESQSQADPTGFHVNVLEIAGTAQTANDNGADINAILDDTGTAGVVVASIAANAITATAIANDAITDAKVASDVTIASVTGAVGSVTGAVGSVTGAVGSVTGAVGSVTGAVGSVTGNVGGNVTGSVGSVATGGISAASFAAGAIDAAAIAANAIGASELAADAVTEIQSGLATSSALSSLETRLRGLVMAQGTIGSTGNSTTALHLDGLTYGNDEINNCLLVIFDVSESEYHARWVEDWVIASELATVATLPFTPQDATDTYWLLPVRQDVTGGSGLDAAGVRAAVGLASANLDTQLATIDSNVDDVLADTGTDGVLISSGTGTGQISLTSGVAQARLADGVAHGGTLGSSTATLALSRITIASQSSNTSAMTVVGNGTGHGVSISSGGGATGNGMYVVAASTNGHAVRCEGIGTGSGIYAVGGNSTGAGMAAVGGTSGDGFFAAGIGSGSGIASTGGATGHGAVLRGGATSGAGLRCIGPTDGQGIYVQGVGEAGIYVTSNESAVILIADDAGLILQGGTGHSLQVSGTADFGGALTADNASNDVRLGTAAMAAVNAEVDTALSDVGLTTTITGRIDAAITSRLAPTTAGRTLDVTATGAAGIDWGNVENQGTTVSLAATTVSGAGTVTTLTSLNPSAALTAGLLLDVGGVVSSTSTTVTYSNTTSLAAGLVGATVAIQDAGAGEAGQPRLIVAAVNNGNGTVTLTVDRAWDVNPTDSDPSSVVVLPGGVADVRVWRGTQPLALSSQQVQAVVPATQQVDVHTIKTQSVTCASGVTILASVGTAATSTAQTGDSYAIVSSGTHGNSALKTLIDAVDAVVDLILADTGTDGVVVANLSAAICNKVADHVRRRTQANVEASSDGDTLDLSSLYGFVQQAQEASVSGTTLTVKKTDGSTTLGTKTLATDADADPVTGVS